MEPESILLEGILALQQGDRERAGALLVRYTRMNPKSAEGWMWLSRCLDQPKEIDYCLDKARKIDPKLVEAFNQQPEQAAEKETVPASTTEMPKAKFRLSGLSPRMKKMVWVGAGVFVLVMLLGGWLLYRDRRAKLISINPIMMQARQDLVDCGEDCDYAQIVEKLNQVLKIDPRRNEARFMRAQALTNLAVTRYDPNQALDELTTALGDIDIYIADNQPNGRDYALRYRIYRALAERQELRINAEQLLRVAMENLLAADQLGDNSLSQLDLPFLYFELGMCGEGQDDLDRLFAKLPPGEDNAILTEWASIARLSCDDDLTGSLDELDRSINIYPEDLRADDTRLLQRALIFYYSGESERALDELDQIIYEKPDGGGERYFLRALVLYEQGMYDLVETDLEAGEANTWQRGGIDAYVRYLLALDAGQDDEAMQYIQQAEASTLPGIYTPMIDLYHKELEGIGADPLEQTVDTKIHSTPIAIER